MATSKPCQSILQVLLITVTARYSSRLADWPFQFFVHPTQGRPILNEVLAWVERDAPPLCTFMPYRLRDANDHTTNQTHFRSLSRILFEQQMVSAFLILPTYIFNKKMLPGCNSILEY